MEHPHCDIDNTCGQGNGYTQAWYIATHVFEHENYFMCSSPSLPLLRNPIVPSSNVKLIRRAWPELSVANLATPGAAYLGFSDGTTGSKTGVGHYQSWTV